jgi:predicted unusual protein kinase regulating ubiquinone biosynthesis (AarF/ABC1/UbiB family)
MVLPHNKLMFVDFGACGTFSRRDRHLMLRMHYAHSQKDIRGMVESVIGLMEPLPPMNVDEFRNKLEKEYWDGYFGLQSKHSDWRDRTSYRLWVALFNLVREYNIPIPLSVVRMIRATLLYDTMAAQLYNRIDVFKEFRKYHKRFARRVRDKLISAVVRQALCGPDLKWYVTFMRAVKLGRTAFFRLQKFIDEAPFNSIQAVANKIFFFFSTAAQWLLSVAAVVTVFWVFFHFQGQALPITPSTWSSWAEKYHHQGSMSVFAVILGIITLATLNSLRMRFNDPDLS